MSAIKVSGTRRQRTAASIIETLQVEKQAHDFFTSTLCDEQHGALRPSGAAGDRRVAQIVGDELRRTVVLVATVASRYGRRRC